MASARRKHRLRHVGGLGRLPTSNFRRAGVLKNRSRTSTCVPIRDPAARASDSTPASTASLNPAVASRGLRQASVSRDTAAIDGSASPRKPNVRSPQIVGQRNPGWRDAAAPAARRRAPYRSRRRRRAPGAGRRPRSRFRRAVPRVQRVLDQLLDHRRGPLDHLAGRDLVGQRRREHPDLQPRCRRVALHRPGRSHARQPLAREARECGCLKKRSSHTAPAAPATTGRAARSGPDSRRARRLRRPPAPCSPAAADASGASLLLRSPDVIRNTPLPGWRVTTSWTAQMISTSGPRADGGS